MATRGRYSAPFQASAPPAPLPPERGPGRAGHTDTGPRPHTDTPPPYGPARGCRAPRPAPLRLRDLIGRQRRSLRRAARHRATRLATRAVTPARDGRCGGGRRRDLGPATAGFARAPRHCGCARAGPLQRRRRRRVGERAARAGPGPAPAPPPPAVT
ncbi:unnamed protein product [Coccothraustes coccothraustes]